MTKPFRVLALDGGGMRGIYTAAFLKTLQDHYTNSTGSPIDVGACFDLITGTSTGGLLACGLAHGTPLNSIIDLYRNQGHDIFPDPVPNSNLHVIQTAKFLYWAVKNSLSPSANQAALRKNLEAMFGDMTFSELYQQRKIRICIPVANINIPKSQVIKTPHHRKYVRDGKLKVVDVCLATSAAPTYFPISYLKNQADENEAFVDGGLWANNPALIGFVEALNLTKATKQPIQILSLGTCPPPSGNAVPPKDKNKGLLFWKGALEAFSLSLDVQATGHFEILENLCDALSTRGVDCQVLRPRATPPSNKMRVALDRCDKESIQALTALATRDANEALRSKRSGCDNYRLLDQIFMIAEED